MAVVATTGDVQTQYLTMKMELDMAHLLKGLPDNLCPCTHWGYVFKGSVRVRYADHEEVINAGDAFYMAPGHCLTNEAGTEMLQFTKKGPELDQTTETIQRNMAAMQSQAGSQP